MKKRVKPAYARQPTGYHKHNLYVAEIATGTVQRSEYMKAFTASPFAVEKKSAKGGRAEQKKETAAAGSIGEIVVSDLVRGIM